MILKRVTLLGMTSLLIAVAACTDAATTPLEADAAPDDAAVPNDSVVPDDGAAPDDGTVAPPDAAPDPWLPAPGQITNINQNNALDVDIDKGVASPYKWYSGYGGYNSFQQMAYAWNGAVWCDGYSPQGALAFFGGGHGANIGCFSYLFDVTTRKWRQVGAERNLPPADDWSGGAPYGSVPDKREPAWFDYDYKGSRIIVLAHQYASVGWLSPDEGGAPKVGSLLVPNGERDQSASQGSKWGGWTFALDDGLMSRSIATAAPLTGTGSGQLIAVKDPVNRKLWYFAQGNSQAHFQDLTAPVPRPLKTHAVAVEPGAPNKGYMVVYNVTWLFVPEARAALAFLGGGSVNSGMGVVLVDFSSGVPVMAAVSIPSLPAGPTGLAHGGFNAGAAWDSKRKRIVLYEGLGDAVTHVLTPSSLDFRTCTWAWSRESYSGRPPANWKGVVGAASSLDGAWGRWRYVKPLDVFLWTDGPQVSGQTEDGVTRNGIVQFWNSVGTAL